MAIILEGKFGPSDKPTATFESFFLWWLNQWPTIDMTVAAKDQNYRGDILRERWERVWADYLRAYDTALLRLHASSVPKVVTDSVLTTWTRQLNGSQATQMTMPLPALWLEERYMAAATLACRLDEYAKMIEEGRTEFAAFLD